jgi:3-hydroxyisobutyrate dehydrogenase-like beta-hydroxyacid dehydrogenase
MRVGVIGTGAMGRPIAMNCLAAGHSVIVYNRTRAKADELHPKSFSLHSQQTAFIFLQARSA